MSLTILEGSLELGAVGEMAYALAVGLSVAELPFDDVALLGGQLTLAVGFVALPLAYVGVSVLPDEAPFWKR